MKTYFAKYLPVEGKMKYKDQARLKVQMIVYHPTLGDQLIEPTDELTFLHKDREGMWFCVRKHHGTGTSGICLPKEEFQKFDLLLSSRNVKIGDKIWGIRDGGWYTYHEGTCTDIRNTCPFIGDIRLIEWGLVIGKISPEAVWVKEGMEFGEDELLQQGTGVNLTAGGGKIKIKCPTCKTFH
jgi:hypothetical protein